MIDLKDREFVQEVQRLAYLEALAAIRNEKDPMTVDLIDVAKGRVPGHSLVHKYGRNPDTDPAASANIVKIGRDVWDGGIAGAVPWVPPTTARIHQLASTDDEDGGAGTDTGALTCHVFGLDADYHLFDEIITLNGTTDAPTSAYTMIYRLKILTAGSEGGNIGTITATADTDGTVTAQIAPDNNSTLMAIYQVPAGKTGYFIDWEGGMGRAGAGAATFADIFLMVKDFGGVWQIADNITVSRDGDEHHQVVLDLAVDCPAKGYIKVVADPNVVAQDTNGGFTLLLVDDGF
jgi:hypothetical protein